MKTCFVCKVEKTPGEFHKKPTGRFGVSGTCKDCQNAKSKAYQTANKTAVRAKSAAYREANREETNAREREKYAANGEKIRAANRAYYWANREDRAEKNRAWREQNADWLAKYEADRSGAAYLKNLAYRLNNPEKWRAIMAEAARRRQMATSLATPAWADKDAIHATYFECQVVSQETGVPHHVDHIVPLVSPLVCGLHVEYNLQIIPASENLAKSNKFEVLTTWQP